MFYRRKVILALTQLLGGKIEKNRIQKLLFLYTQRKRNAEYDFVPYKFGCYSFSAKADLETMIKNESFLLIDDCYVKNSTIDYVKGLKVDDQKILKDVVRLYGNMSRDSLVKHIYINFPYYATKSAILNDVLVGEQLLQVLKLKTDKNDKILFTIGYEGISLEKYLNKLITNDIKLLVDVRKNPLSMKFGFSKSLLKKYCQSLDINYLHIPEVGINSDQRQELNEQQDYDNLFDIYKKTTLLETKSHQETIINLLLSHDRIALTCFEADICRCHRKPLAEAIEKNPIFDYQIKHI